MNELLTHELIPRSVQ